MEKYLAGIPWDKFEGIPGLYVTAHHIKGWRYFSAYKNGEGQKGLIFQKLAAAGMMEDRGHWDWHHVVEGNHLEPLFSPADYKRLYNHEWPTVLMHSAEEHKILNSLFRLKGTTEGLPKAGAAALAGNARADYLRTLYQRYHDIYTGDFILQKVAYNLIRGLR